jgi:TolB-like protein
MSAPTLQKTLTALLSAALIAVHLPAQAAASDQPANTNSVTYQMAGNPNSDPLHKPSLLESSKTLAVVDFANDTGEPRFDNLKRGISESLVTKLAKRPELHLVERSQIDKALKEIGFGQTAFADSAKVAQLGKMTGANTIITGSIVKGGSRFEINVRMLDVETGKVLVSESYLFQSEDEILPVVNYLSLLIPQKLNLPVTQAELQAARDQIKDRVVSNDNAWVYWSIGAGVLIVAAIVTGIVLVTRAKANEGPDIVITNPNGSQLTLKATDNPLLFNLPAVKF